MIKRLRQWWKDLMTARCDYCKKKTETWYEAYLFPVPEYKGVKICPDCIKKLETRDNETIIWVE